MAQTALPRPVTGLQPQTSLSASTICRPRPASSFRSGILSTGALSDGSSTAHMTSPVRRSLHRLVAERLPGESTRGLTTYAVMRALQIRRFRVPAPRVAPGDKI